MASDMAVSSSGVDWCVFLKPFLSSTTNRVGNKSELLELCTCIIRGESDILRQKDTNRDFFNSFAILSSNFISNRTNNLTASQLETVCAACTVLLKYIVAALKHCSLDSCPNSVQIEYFLNAIHVLCLGKGILPSSEVLSLVKIMKGDHFIQHSSPVTGEKELQNKPDSTKSKSDLCNGIYEQLTLPLREGHNFEQVLHAQLNLIDDDTNTNEVAVEINKLFLKANTESLQALRAGDIFLDLCLNLPSIRKSRTKVEDALAGKPFSSPSNYMEATSVRNGLTGIVADLKIVTSAITLPVLEPLTPTKLDKLNHLSMAVLYCAINQATASAILCSSTSVSPKCAAQAQALIKEDDLDSNAVILVEQALKTYLYIGTTIKTSTRAGGHIYQNHLLTGAWVLISGLQAHLCSNVHIEKLVYLREREEKSKSPCKSRELNSGRLGFLKYQQGFGVLSVALATKTLVLLTELFEDLNLETCTVSSNIQVDPAPLSIMGQFTALQRVIRILNTAPLNQLLFYLAMVSYRKASTLKKIHPPGGDNCNQSKSSTYYEDMILCSDESSTDEDDSEPLLGHWFEETLAPSEGSELKCMPTDYPASKASPSERSHSIVPERGEAHCYISLASNIFEFLNKYFLEAKTSVVSRYVKTGLTEQQMLILAAIIKDLDRESSRTEVGTISVYYGSQLGMHYNKFSGALTKFTHNVITHVNFTALHHSFLNDLGIIPMNTELLQPWPLQIYPRTLAVLAQVLLLRNQNEKEASIINIWHRFINTLTDTTLNVTQLSLDSDNEDLNVEHAQVLLYLFHSLNLMQKKSVFLSLADGILKASEIIKAQVKDLQILHLSRLLLLFDYLMKHLYDPPALLLEQIQYNLFFASNFNTEKEKENATRLFTAWQDIEANYHKVSASNESTFKPRFYALTNYENNNQDAPKLDGLACNFILSTPDKIHYSSLLNAFMQILKIVDVTSGPTSSSLTFLGICGAQYCFTICWRLLQLLPPSMDFLQSLAMGEISSEPLLLNASIWGRRITQKSFGRWLKDCLVKQGIYTQHADKLLKSAADAVNNLKHDTVAIKNYITHLLPQSHKVSDMPTRVELPSISSLYLLDVLLAKLQVDLEENENNQLESSAELSTAGCTYIQELLPYILRVIQFLLQCTRWSLLQMADTQTDVSKYTTEDLEPLQDVVEVSSCRNPLINSLAIEFSSLLPTAISSVQTLWNNLTLEEFSSVFYQNDIIWSENYILKILDIHICSLSKSMPVNINLSLKRVLQCFVKFICEHTPKIDNTDTKNKAVELLVSLTIDSKTEYLYETVSKALDKMIGDSDTDEHQKRVYLQVLNHTYKLIVNFAFSNDIYSSITESLLTNCFKFYEKIIEKSSGRQALEAFFTEDKNLVKVLLSVSNPNMSQNYSTRVLHFFNKLFQARAKSSTDPSLNYLCNSMSKLADIGADQLQALLKQIILGTGAATESSELSEPAKVDELLGNSDSTSKRIFPSKSTKSLTQENSQLLQGLISFIVETENNVTEDVSITILKALLPLACKILQPDLEGVGFTDLMVVINALADGGSGKGHMSLFPVCLKWIELINSYFSQRKDFEKTIVESSDSNMSMLHAACCVLEYVSEIVQGVLQMNQPGSRTISPSWDGEVATDLENDWQEDVHEEVYSGDDSEDDSFSNKLCTFTITQKEFMNQHWYHCHTCQMLDGVGVCSVCAKVCHKGHDLSYAKYGNFFCDCGAKEDGSCQALTKRKPQTINDVNAITSVSNIEKFSSELVATSLRKCTASASSPKKNILKERKVKVDKQLHTSKEFIVNYLELSPLTTSLTHLLEIFIPAIEFTCSYNSPIGCHLRAVTAIQRLHQEDKEYINTDQLMMPTLGSQEGAFENVRMTYTGEQGQTIRQLLSAHIIKRVAMCCMTSSHGRRQHLAVSHEKGKITILQLSALLKQADSSTRKLTLTRLSSAPIPFTVLMLSSNLCNEELLAVCGLKDCHVLTFTNSGSVSSHLVLHPELDTGNFIIKALWLPGSQTMLALITADFVKIYELSVDSLSPQYYFLIPSGKIRDATFMYSEGIYHILLMSSTGHIYNEVLDEETSAKHGSFYITSTLEVLHLEVTDMNGQIAGGGVSIYYSHLLRLLFYSYAQGKSFISPVSSTSVRLTSVFPITLPTSSNASKSNGSRTAISQALCQWTEIPNHPGLICCSMQSSNNPVILMIKPDCIMIQEIKVVPTKSKIMDTVAIRHSSGNELRTTLILLCEDGSLKMYIANMDKTGFWMSPRIQPTQRFKQYKLSKNKSIKTGKMMGSSTFPVDFFEHCQPMNDVEIGGSDLLQVYNPAQLKHRLNTINLYVACNKPLGFSVEISNNDSNMVMTGLRVLLGSQDIQRAPSFVEIFGRIISTSVSRSRWFDIPFTKEESLLADKKLIVMFGPSQDPESVTMVDSIKIFGKTKDTFGWPEEHEDTPSTLNIAPTPSLIYNGEQEYIGENITSINKLEKLTVAILQTLDGIFLAHKNSEKLSIFKTPILNLCTKLLTLPTSASIQINTKALISSLHSTRQQYHNYKDQVLLEYALTSLNTMIENFSKDGASIDAESYYRIILTIKNIAIARPQNLVKFAEHHISIQDIVIDDPFAIKVSSNKDTKNHHLILELVDVLWKLHSLNPDNPSLVSVVIPGLKHTEQVIYGIVEIINAFNTCESYNNITIAIFLQLLLSADSFIAFSTKQALAKVLRPKNKKKCMLVSSSPTCSTPHIKDSSDKKQMSMNLPPDSEFQNKPEGFEVIQQHSTDNESPSTFEALLGNPNNFSPLIDIPPDADDETMVELAIALSLQDHDIGNPQQLHGLQIGSAGSESGGSGVESITGEHNISGRSSAYGDNMPDVTTVVSRSDTSSLANTNFPINEPDNISQEVDLENDCENIDQLHNIRLHLLERLIEYLPKLRHVKGVRVIPYFQVVLQLTSDLNGHYERDRSCFNSLLSAIIMELDLENTNTEIYCARNNQQEIRLILMRLLSVFMSKYRTNTSGSSSSDVGTASAGTMTDKTANLTDNSTFISKATASFLYKSKVIGFCNKLLQSLLDYWRNYTGEEENPSEFGENLLKKHVIHNLPDMTPFFLKQFVKENARDVFASYPQLMTEMALRLPYQVYRYSDMVEPILLAFDNSWYHYLCEYMMISQVQFIRRQVRKLLLFICGNKEKYRQLRDLHALNTHMKAVKDCCESAGYDSTAEYQNYLSLHYDSLVEIIEHLRACLEIAVNRTGNWQRYCIFHNNNLSYLFRLSFSLEEGIAPTILHLLQSAIVTNGAGGTKKTDQTSRSLSHKEREKSDDSTTEACFEEANCVALIEQIHAQLSKEYLTSFIKTFLLESNITNIRWQAHSLILAVYRNSSSTDQDTLLDLLWQLWLLLPAYGNKAVQFIDLLGYFSLKYSQRNEGSSQVLNYINRVVGVLTKQNKLLSHHPNANLYAHISQFVDLEGYYLEPDPCLVCNNPEVPFSSIKLSSIKVDSKFTTTTQIVKLISTHVISKITIRIGDLKRTKMVKTINIYYNNRNVQAIIELKNKPLLWYKAKKVTLQSGQQEVKVDFPLPIIACNFMVEYSTFYENIQASSETLQCPRCSAAVPANPGVCTTCGENVFQCHKCRAINYDEKDPFLCHACGFCKYAKFDFTLLAKACCAVEPIENDEDRKKMVSNINSLLEKADRLYKQLTANKPMLESIILKIMEQRFDKKYDDLPSVLPPVNNSNTVNTGSSGQIKVNKSIQALAHQYCNECRSSFEELSKIIQKVLASRKELVIYDRQHRDLDFPRSTTVTLMGPLSEKEAENDLSRISCVHNKCYSCCTATIEHCLTLLKALASNVTTRRTLCSKEVIHELVCNNLRKGNTQIQGEVRQLLCMLTSDNFEATDKLCCILTEKIATNLKGYKNSIEFGMGVRHEVALLSTMVEKEDETWELKLKCMMEIFLMACEDSNNPLVMESIILPCLKILYTLMKPDVIKKSKDKEDQCNRPDSGSVTVNIHSWLNDNADHTFSNWMLRLRNRPEIFKIKGMKQSEVRQNYLMIKYFHKWRSSMKSYPHVNVSYIDSAAWMSEVLFNSSSQLARQMTCNIVELMCNSNVRKGEILVMLTSFLREVSYVGESSAEFLTLYQNLIQETEWKKYLTLRGVLLVLAYLITIEIEKLQKLEETTLTSDLTQGYALNRLTEILASFLEDFAIRRQYKQRLVGYILNGYLSLRRLIVQRTRLIDDTQEKLLELLEDMTTGTQDETKAFMTVCIKTVEKYSLQDIWTPLFIFERLCSIIYPEENSVLEFFLTLEKDPQQEDFLQGRMLGNPYSSLEAGLGPLMRDVKNKICLDCELVALLEDDNGMELLVNNKIISLDLAVKDVYKKVWLAEGGDQDAMRIVYRMRGLLGDATEEFIENLENKAENSVNNEDVYKMANVLANCDGLSVMVKRLGAIQNIWRARPLVQVLLKLFRLCAKVIKCQEILIQPELGAMEVFLRTLQLCLDDEHDLNQVVIMHQLLDIMATIVSKATSKSIEDFSKFSQTFGGTEYIKALISCTAHTSVKCNQSVLIHLVRVLAALTYGNEERMDMLLDYFRCSLNFNKFDFDHNDSDQERIEMFCVLANGIEKNSIGNTLKDHIVQLGVVKDALDYIMIHSPCTKPTLSRTDSDDLKEFISKPALKYILRFLTGMGHSHNNTQMAIASANAIPIIHKLEQVSSDEHVGSLAENLLEALCTNPFVAKEIEDVRESTRSEKKRLAMAMREKQLGQLGMRTNDKGQVTAKSTILQQIDIELGEESGLICCICREGYKFQPTKVLGVYTFTKKCNIDDYESKSKKTSGYSTVTHFNVVHIDCHMSAVRLARVRDEWESAALQNANTKCNGLLPLWGPQVPESAFASCLARHNTYLQESTNCRDIGHIMVTVHDIKLLLLRFAYEKSFHEDTGGGGPQSNMHFVPYLIHVALYVVNTTRAFKRENNALMAYLESTDMERWVESAYETENSLYFATLSLLIHSQHRWKNNKTVHLRRLLVLAHTRSCQPVGPCKLISDKNAKEYPVYKPYMIFFGLIDSIYQYFFKNVGGPDEQWPTNLADYIRHNDESLIKTSEKLLAKYTEELLPCTTFAEFCDIIGLLEDISDPETYISNLLKGM